MKLLDLISLISVFGRIKRRNWENTYIVRSINDDTPLIVCYLDHLVMKNFLPTYLDYIADDWEIVE